MARLFRQTYTKQLPAEGDCMKQAEHSGEIQDTEAHRFFTWADNSCDDFEARDREAEQ